MSLESSKARKISVLITCYNRKDKTLACLQKLFEQDGLDTFFKIQVFLVDDGSTDGTAELIKDKYPKVKIIQGDGSLYWNRGMNLAWKTAMNTGDYSGFLWLNDDTAIFKNALKTLVAEIGNCKILVGTTKSQFSGICTYGGYRNKRMLISPNGQIQPCDYFNGNFVFVPKEVSSVIGILDNHFHHALGDFEYGMRAKSAGFECCVLPFTVGYCEGHEQLPKWRDPAVGLYIRLQCLYSPLSGCHPKEFFYFDRKYKGLLIAVFHFISIHVRTIAPKFFSHVRNLR